MLNFEQSVNFSCHYCAVNVPLGAGRHPHSRSMQLAASQINKIHKMQKRKLILATAASDKHNIARSVSQQAIEKLFQSN